jgi:hypothetical protein
MATQYTAGLTTGQVLTAAIMNQIGAAWESYTPAWTSNGTAPAIGNGVLTGTYGRINKTVFGQIFMKTGSTSTYGTGTYRFSLPPIASTGLNSFSTVGYGYVLDVSAANVTTVILTRSGNTDRVDLRFTGGGFGELTATAPYTFANGDEFHLSFFYQAA